jgi:hypothetical protein
MWTWKNALPVAYALKNAQPKLQMNSIKDYPKEKRFTFPIHRLFL